MMIRLGFLMLLLVVALCAVSSISTAADQERPQKFRVYVGTYTGPKSQGIYLFELDTATGRLTSMGLAGEAKCST